MDKEKRKVNYWLLKEAGFTGKEANKLKDRSDEKVRLAIEFGEYVKLMKLKMIYGGGGIVWQPEQNEENKDIKE